jgi:quinol monooxygenase YgiN
MPAMPGARLWWPVMIVEYIRYTINAERADSFVSAYDQAGASLRASEHCLGYELTRCTEAADSFILRIVWDSERGHLEGFRASPPFKSFFAAIQPYVKDITEMRHYAATAVAWTRS